MKLESLIEELIAKSPSGESREVKHALTQLVHQNESTLVSNAILNHLEGEGHAIDKTIIFRETKQAEKGKFLDYVKQKSFRFDEARLFDPEEASCSEALPSYFKDLVDSLAAYGSKQYPNSFAFNVFPVESALKIVIISEKVDLGNFYSGRWKSIYTLRGAQIEGEVVVDVHYFEDGNVRFHLKEKVDNELHSESVQDIVSYIKVTEDNLVLKTINQFEELNQNHFKHLRRLLPVTKAKVNWGKAIGNYRLGTTVANRG